MNIIRISKLNGQVNSMKLDITPAQFARYEKGVELVQDIFPNLSNEEREFLISGITPDQWRETFGELNEDEL